MTKEHFTEALAKILALPATTPIKDNKNEHLELSVHFHYDAEEPQACIIASPARQSIQVMDNLLVIAHRNEKGEPDLNKASFIPTADISHITTTIVHKF